MTVSWEMVVRELRKWYLSLTHPLQQGLGHLLRHQSRKALKCTVVDFVPFFIL